jgi:hypothetical protein
MSRPQVPVESLDELVPELRITNDTCTEHENHHS